MEVIDAVWEQRNLGIRSAEVTLKTDADMVEFENAVGDLEAIFDYLCVKVKSGYGIPLIDLPRLGYVFVEDQILLRYSTKNDCVAPMVHRLVKLVNEPLFIEDITDDDKRFTGLMDRIVDERLFRTDRIALDPCFGVDVANKRYVGWCNDLRDKGSRFYISKVGEYDAGFSVYTYHGSGRYSSPLGGSFESEHVDPAYSPVFSRLYIDHLKKDGMRILDTAVSSNNRVILQLHLLSGCQVREVFHVYIKHSMASEKGIII